MTTPVKSLRKIGCQVEDRETTKRAQKWWLSYPPGCGSLEEARKRVMEALEIRMGSYEGSLLGDGYYCMFQTEHLDGHSGVYLCKPKVTNKIGSN